MTSNFEAARRAQTMEVFEVRADAGTGEWIGEPVATGEVTSFWDWCKKEDTAAVHYDTYVFDVDTQAERALMVKWAE